MKKCFSLFLVLSLLAFASAAFAEGLGVQVIGGTDTGFEPAKIDNLELNTEAEIKGWGAVTATGFEVQDGLGHYLMGEHTFDTFSTPYDYYWSGDEAEYLVLYADILNTRTVPVDFLENAVVKVVYEDYYEFGGWGFQRDYHNKTDRYSYKLEADKGSQNTRFAIAPEDQFKINTLYQGHYIFGCTVPNAVVDGEGPLKMVITIDGNEITYVIRGGEKPAD